ncbi:MAG: EpsG family protein [bacterium]
MVYWILIFIAILTYPLCNKKIALVGFGKNKIIKTRGLQWYLLLNGTLSILIVGLRHVEIGRDTAMYLYKFNKVNNYEHFFSAIESEKTEVGYSILEFIVGRVFSFEGFQIIVAIISIIPLFYIIYKYSKIPWLSIFIFITFGFLSFNMLAMRQAVALGITTFSYKYIMERKFMKFIICIILAFSFHLSAIIFLPAYWFGNIKFTKYTKHISLIVIFFAFILKERIFLFVNLYARLPYSYLEAGGEKMYIFVLFSVILGLIYDSGYQDKARFNKTLLFMIIAVAIIWPIASFHPGVFRLYYYYSIFLVLFIPNIIELINNKVIKRYIYMVYIIVGSYYLITQIILRDNNMNPYYFFWN